MALREVTPLKKKPAKKQPAVVAKPVKKSGKKKK
jgi:hypothetical protein